MTDKVFWVSLPGGDSFAQVRIDGKANGRWLATPLSGGGDDLDLPKGTHLTLLELAPPHQLPAEVLYVEGPPSWSYRTLHPVLTKHEDTKVFLQSAERTFRQPSSKDVEPLGWLPPTLLGYRAVVLGDVTAGTLHGRTLWAFVRDGGGLILRPGKEGLAQYGSLLAALAPVTDHERAEGGAANVGGFTTPADHPAAPTLGGAMPAIRRTRLATARQGADVLLADAEGRPIIAAWSVGRGKVIYVGTSSLYEWKRALGKAGYATLWTNLIRWIKQPGAKRDLNTVELDLKDASLADAVDLLVQQCGQPVLCSGEPTQRVSMHVKGLWRASLDEVGSKLDSVSWNGAGVTYAWRSGDKITARFSNTSLRTVLTYLVQRSGLKGVRLEGQGERVSVNWTGKTLDECLEDLGSRYKLRISVQSNYRIQATYIEDD